MILNDMAGPNAQRHSIVGSFVVGPILWVMGCAAVVPHPVELDPARRGGVTFIRPRCPADASCVLGQVTTAESALPLARAAVFLEREDADASGQPIRFATLTDDQGVFSVRDAPSGRYRLAIYKDARRIEARGLELGGPGTTVVPVRMPPV